MDKNSLAHTQWECKVSHRICAKISAASDLWSIWQEIGKILQELCERKGIEIIEAELCVDHVHMLVRIPPKYSVSEIMGTDIRVGEYGFRFCLELGCRLEEILDDAETLELLRRYEER